MPNAQYPFAPPPEPGDKAAPRRRRHRRSRRGGSGTSQAAAGQNRQEGGANRAPNAAQNTPGDARAQNRPGREHGSRPAPRGERRSGTPNRQRTPQPRAAQNSTADRAPAAAQDPGLLLITRRPPKQKFSSFEEYIAAHGGVTAPLPGDETPPDPAPETE